MSKMELPPSVTGETEARRRRQMTIITCTVVGVIIVCLAAYGGYLIYKKIEDNTTSSSQLTLSAGRQAATSSMTTMKAEAPDPIHSSVSTLSASSSELNSTRVLNGQTTADSSVINRHESPSLTTDSTVSQHLLPTDSTTALPLDIADINHDPCLSAFPDICNNMTGLVFGVCECDDDGLWTVIQKRFDGSVDFYRNWVEYKSGFGDVNGEYWLGNEALHNMTASVSYTLKIVLKDRYNVTKYAIYDTFKVTRENDGYRLTISGFSGDAGDSMIPHNDYMFSTKDRDNDINTNSNCAVTTHSGWWFGGCGDARINGKYYTDGVLHNDGIVWWSWYQTDQNTGFALQETKMLLRANTSE